MAHRPWPGARAGSARHRAGGGHRTGDRGPAGARGRGASNRARDLFEKRRIYAGGGAAWYWVVDPAVPSLTVLRLVDGAYVEEARIVAQEVYETKEPLSVRVVPAELLL